MNNWIKFFVLNFVCVSAVAAPDPKAIMVKSEEARRVQTMISEATLITSSEGAPDRKKEFKWWRKLGSDQKHFNTLTRFFSPAEVKGQGILFLEKSSDENEILMYLPAYKKIRRVETQSQSSSFMGSEFSYSDITSFQVDDYKYKYLKEEPCPVGTDPTQPALKCHVIEAVPASDSVKTRTGYSKVIQWVRFDQDMIAQTHAFNEAGEWVKEIKMTEMKKYDSRWVAHRVSVNGIKTKRATVLNFSKVEVNKPVLDSTFTQQQLSKE